MTHFKLAKKPRTFILIILAIILVMLVIKSCHQKELLEQNGYIESEPTLIASSQSGTLTTLNVSKGQWIQKGHPLFKLEQENEMAQLAEANAKYQRLQAILEDNTKGKRPEERDALRAELDAAKASLKLSEIEVKRQTNLIQSGYTSKSNLDTLIAQRDKNQAAVKEIMAQMDLAELGVRQDLLTASEADVKIAEAQMVQAKWRLDQKNMFFESATTARVEDIFFRLGEWVPSGHPVIKLQTPALIKARFFIPEAMLPKIKLGQQVTISCDGCPDNLTGAVSFISDRAEFTPPVIFSQQRRERLVFMIEALPTPKQAVFFKAGQPIQVHWQYIEPDT